MKIKSDFACKQASVQSFKFGIDETGDVQGYGSVFGNIDSVGERVVRGAFAASIAKFRSAGGMPLMLWQHRAAEPVGRWIDISEDDIGLRMSGKFNLNTSRGRDAYEHVKAGDVGGLSIGYRELRTRQNGPVLDLLELDLVETSIVSNPANSRARITGVKAETCEDIERLLREGGLSRGAAMKIAKAGWPALSRDSEENPSIKQLAARLDSATAELQKLKGLFS